MSRHTLPALAVALVAAGLSYNGSVDGAVDLYHEGDRLAVYDALTAGRLPFRDVFVQHGIGEDLLKPWLAFHLWGPSVESLRRMGANTYIYRGVLPALGVAALIVAAAALTRNAVAAGAVGLAALLTFCESTDRHVFGLLTLAAMAMHLHTGRRSVLALAGLCGGLAMVYSLEVGLYALFAAAVGIVAQPSGAVGRAAAYGTRTRRLLLLAIGPIVVWTAVVAWCIRYGIAWDLVDNVRIQLFTRGAVFPVSYPLPMWADAAPAWVNGVNLARVLMLFYVMPLMPVAGVVLMLVHLQRRSTADERTTDAAATGPTGPSTAPTNTNSLQPTTAKRPTVAMVLMCAAFASCFWIGVKGRPDHWHIAYAVPAWLLFAITWWLQGQVHATRGAYRFTCAGVILVILALGVLGQGGALGRRVAGVESWWLPNDLKHSPGELVHTGIPRMGQTRVPRWQAAYLHDVLSAIHELARPGDTLLDLTNQPLLHFLSERRPPTRFACESYVGASTELQDDMLAELRLRSPPPACIIRFRAGHHDRSSVDRFVAERFVATRTVGPFEVGMFRR